MRAAGWIETYWISEFGNYTNATAGYVGFNKASGIEGNWRYMLHDTVGSLGTNKHTSIKTFILLLVQYIGDHSKLHAIEIWCPVTGIHKFPSVP